MQNYLPLAEDLEFVDELRRLASNVDHDVTEQFVLLDVSDVERALLLTGGETCNSSTVVAAVTDRDIDIEGSINTHQSINDRSTDCPTD